MRGSATSAEGSGGSFWLSAHQTTAATATTDTAIGTREGLQTRRAHPGLAARAGGKRDAGGVGGH